MPPTPDLEQLLSNPSTSDAEIAAALLADYHARLFRLACSFLQEADEAEDAVQQTLVKALYNLESYIPGSNFRAWLFTIAVNVCRGMLRKRRTRRALVRLLGLDEDHSGNPALDKSADPEEAFLAKEDALHLWSAVDHLPEKYRWAVHLRFEQELTVAEIAQVLSISEKAVYSRLYEAFHRLQRQIDNGAGAPLAQPASGQPAEQPAEAEETTSEDLWLTLGNSIWLILYAGGMIGPLLLGLVGILLGVRQAHTAWLVVLLAALILSEGLTFLMIDPNSGSALGIILAVPFIVIAMALLATHLWESRGLWSRLTWLGIALLLVAMILAFLGHWYSPEKREVFDRSGFLVVMLVGLIPALVWQSWKLKGRLRWIFYGLLSLSLLGAAGIFLSFTLRALGVAGGWLDWLTLGEFFYSFLAVILAAKLVEAWLSSPRRPPLLRLISGGTLAALLFTSLYAMIRSEAIRFSLFEDPVIVTIFLWSAACMALVAAVSLAWKIKGKRMWAFATLIVTFAILLSPAMLVPQTLPYRLTERGAERLNRAILDYHADQGAYSASIAELVPRYLLLVPEPITYYLRVWCYDGGVDYYRLGYYDSENYCYNDYASVFVKEYASAGNPPEQPIPCETGKP